MEAGCRLEFGGSLSRLVVRSVVGLTCPALYAHLSVLTSACAPGFAHLGAAPRVCILVCAPPESVHLGADPEFVHLRLRARVFTPGGA